MALDFRFLSKEQIWGREEGVQLDVMNRFGIMVAPTDLAVLLGADMVNKRVSQTGSALTTSEGDFSCCSWTLSRADDDLHCICVHIGSNESSIPHDELCENRFPSARPALSWSEASKIHPQNINEGPNGVQIGEYGEYPQTIADDLTARKLEKLLESKSLRPTGKNYTFDSVDLENRDTLFKAISYPEYELDGNRYIRVLGRPYGRHRRLSNGEQVKEGKTYWVQVEPIEWLMDKSGWMVAKKCLFSGIQFDTYKYGSYPDKYLDFNFSKTFIKHYLDTYFAKEIEPSKTIEKTKGKKGLTALLSEQGRKEIEDDENVVLFRESRKALIEKKLRGTEKLDSKEKRKAELAILRKTNVQVLRDAEGKARAKKMASILKKKQKTK